MAMGDLFDKGRLCAADVLDGLARPRIGREADEVAGVAGADRHADLAVGLHAADARPVAGARIDHDDRRLQRIDHGAARRNDADEPVVDGTWQRPSVEDELVGEVQNIWNLLRRLCEIDVSPLVQGVEEEEASLPGVCPILHSRVECGMAPSHEISVAGRVHR